MGAGFQNKVLMVMTADGHNCTLYEPLVYRRRNGDLIRAINYSTTDGLSTPAFLWPLIPPFGKIWFSGVIHDAAYRNTLEKLNDTETTWLPITLSEEDSNELIHEAMETQGAGWLEHTVIYIALEWFGWRAFDADRRAVPSTPQL